MISIADVCLRFISLVVISRRGKTRHGEKVIASTRRATRKKAQRALQGYETMLNPETIRKYVPALIVMKNLADLLFEKDRQDKGSQGVIFTCHCQCRSVFWALEQMVPRYQGNFEYTVV